MKPVFNKNKIYLLLVYLALSLPVIYFFPLLFSGYFHLLATAIWLLVVVITYEPLSRIIQEARGYISANDELAFFSAFVELNKKIHKTLEVDDVLILVRDMLEDRVRVRHVLFLINTEIMTPGDSGEASDNLAEPGGHKFRVWGSDEKSGFMTSNLSHDLLNLNKISAVSDVSENIRQAMQETRTGLIIPIVQNDRLLCVVMIGHLNRDKIYSDIEIQMYEYLANQLSIVLDRIRIYEQIMKKTAMDHAEKMQVMQSLSANIAHEMRTPLSGIRASISGIDTYLPDLIEAYQVCSQKSPEQYPGIREVHLTTLKQTPDRITLMIDQASAVIDMLLMNLRDSSLDKRQLSACSAADCINQAVDRYPFKSGERESVLLELEQDFKFSGIEILYIYVIFNLLKNALYSIKSAEKGDITISLRPGDDHNEVRFMDTGEGIDQGVLDKIFEGFFTTKADGTGAGLAFCKRTLESFNGSIHCYSSLGRYTEFVMEFPVIDRM